MATRKPVDRRRILLSNFKPALRDFPEANWTAWKRIQYAPLWEAVVNLLASLARQNASAVNPFSSSRYLRTRPGAVIYS